jgi:hypothetical protein
MNHVRHSATCPLTYLNPRSFQEGYTYLCTHGTFGDALFAHKTLENFEEVVEKYGQRAQCRK